MRIRFEIGTLEDPVGWRYLQKIIELIDDGKHEWHIIDPDLVESTPWFQQLHASHRLLFEKAAMESSRFPSDESETNPRSLHVNILVVGKHRPPQALPPASAYEYLQMPVKILLEDRITDGMFIRAVLLHLARQEVQDLKKLKAIETDSAGGNGNLKNLVESLIQDWEFPGMPLRMVVVTDSDAQLPDKKRGKTAEKLEVLCREHAIACFVLKKRAIENYVPDEVIREYGQKSGREKLAPAIKALEQMDAELRDYFPMKDALDSASKTQEVEYYKNKLSPKDFTALSRPVFQGFGKDFIRILFREEDPHKTRPLCANIG